AAFVLAFGVWDLAYYLGLKLLLGWPDSLLTWDLLFLLPVPWAAPVLAPALVALTMAAAGAVGLWREARGRPLRLGGGRRAGRAAALTAGGLLLVTAFCWDWKNLAAGGMPNPFNWPLFALGEGLGLAAFLAALRGADTAPGVVLPVLPQAGNETG